MLAVSRYQPPERLILRIWSVAVAALGAYLVVLYTFWFLPRLLDFDLRGWGLWVYNSILLGFGLPSLLVFWLGLAALLRPSARTLRQLAILTAWLLWYGLLSVRLQLLGKLGAPTLPGADTPWDNFFNVLFAIAALFACRCMYAWMSQRAPLPETERAKIPNGLRTRTLVAFSICFGILLAVAALQGLGAIGLAPKTEPLARIAGALFAAALAAGGYSLLKKPLVELGAIDRD